MNINLPLLGQQTVIIQSPNADVNDLAATKPVIAASVPHCLRSVYLFGYGDLPEAVSRNVYSLGLLGEEGHLFPL